MEINQTASASKLQHKNQQLDEAEEFAKVIEHTNLETHKILQETLTKLQVPLAPDTYEPKRYKWLKRVCQRLSRDNRSVDIVNGLLEYILCISDAYAVKSNPELYFDCVHTKFIIVTDLAKACKTTTAELLRHAKQQIYSNITYMYSQDSAVGWLIEKSLCGISFYREHIVPRSWFYLLILKSGEQYTVTHEDLQKMEQYLDIDKKAVFSLKQIKRDLFHLFSKIASSNKITVPQKRTAIQTVKQFFGFTNEQELIDLYNSDQNEGTKPEKKSKKNTQWFESMCLVNLLDTIGLSQKFFMEQLIFEREPDKVLRKYQIDLFWEQAFFKTKIANFQSSLKGPDKVVTALEFLSKNVKKDAQLVQSDFLVIFLETFNMIFPKYLSASENKYSATFRQNKLYAFIRMVELILTKQLYTGHDCTQIFEEALIQKTLYVLRLAQHEDTVDMSIFCLQKFLNKIGVSKMLMIYPQVFSLITHAYLTFSQRPKIKRYCQKIFDYYIRDQKQRTIRDWPTIQFIFLQKVYSDEKMQRSIETVSAELYNNESQIELSLRSLVKQIQTSCEDIRMLNVQYIIELLEQQRADGIKRVLCRNDVIQQVYQCVLQIKHNQLSSKSVQFGVLCAKVISMIGLCYPFVNDPILLKANNQQTYKLDKSSELEENKGEGEKLVTAQSERVNPLTNMKYNLEVVDNTLELLAAPILYKLPIERTNYVAFAQNLKKIIYELSHLSEEKPKNFYFVIFLLYRFIKSNGGDEKKRNVRGDQIMHDAGMLQGEELNEDHQTQIAIRRADTLYQTIKRITTIDKLTIDVGLEPYTSSKQDLSKLAIFLINRIEDKKWNQIFEACIPLIKKTFDVVALVLPYITYFAMRCQQQDKMDLPELVSGFFNRILASEKTAHIELILQLIEFLKIAINQDKQRFKQFLEKETKFRYVDKLFFLDINSETKDTNIQSFKQLLTQNPTLKHDFLAVKKLEHFIGKLDRQTRNTAAKKARNLKRCLFNMEDSFRQTVQQNQNEFLGGLTDEEVIEIVSIQKQLLPEDHDHKLFNAIVKKKLQGKDIEMKFSELNLDSQEKSNFQKLRERLLRLLERPQCIDFWQENNWGQLSNWLGDFQISELLKNREELGDLIPLDQEDKKQAFESILALIFAEYYQASQNLLHSNDQQASDKNFQLYMHRLNNVKQLIESLYFEFVFNLEALQGESASQYKLFMHILYEIESAIYFSKDLFISESDKVSEHLKREVNKEKRKFEKIYYDVNMNQQFERLLGWFEERSQQMEVSNEFLVLVYSVRKAIFSMFDRENEYAFYLMKLAKLYRKSGHDVLKINKYFRECQKLSHKIVDFELEYAKYTLNIKNASEAYQYLHQRMDQIKDKADHMQKQLGAAWMPKRVYQKAQLFELELLIKIEPRNEKIFENFSNFVKGLGEIKWEKPNFLFAQYVDMLERNNFYQTSSEQTEERRKRQIQKIFYYMKSVQFGHKYIWQSLPRVLEIWFEFNDTTENKINTYMKQELLKLEPYKIATVHQILLSRFGHEREQVRETIVTILSKLAVQYPEQSAWWFFHFHFFEENQKVPQSSTSRQSITRAEFAKLIINKILADQNGGKAAGEIIMRSETLFGDLKKLSEKQPAKANELTMELPRGLQQISQTTNLVMPTEENLTPQLPPLKTRMQNFLRTLAQTILPLELNNIDNLTPTDLPKNINQEQSYPAYKPNPVKIQSFLTKVTIFTSKERPKKISIIGSDGKTYNFLLKYDKQGDLRKEQRFIDFAVLCNKMLQQDAEARQRGLKMRTYAIVPLSQKTGLIEWIQNTSTLKIIVNDAWKPQNIKGDMSDIKALALKLSKGETHKDCWPEVKQAVKPVLGSWFAEHFPSPDLWYEARVNFIKTTAIWSIIGYVIGLGDRHGDNILIHQHTGEVTHVDFDCIFEKGAKLKVPEIVPFRLTANIMDAFGIFKEKGIFQKCSEVVMRVMRKNQKNILSFLETFKHDPLIENANNIRIDVKDALEVIERKLSGNINVSNGGALTIEEQVEQVILNAISEDNLSKMYIGWMPWL